MHLKPRVVHQHLTQVQEKVHLLARHDIRVPCAKEAEESLTIATQQLMGLKIIRSIVMSAHVII